MFFNLFSSPPEVSIELAGSRPTHKRRLPRQSTQEVDSAEECVVVGDREGLEGKVIVRLNKGATLEHQGLTIELGGTVSYYQPNGAGAISECFMSNKIRLAHAAESPINREVSLYEFSFGNVRLPYESYESAGISLRYGSAGCLSMACESPFRYFVRAMVHRKMGGQYCKELALWRPEDIPEMLCHPYPPVQEPPPIELEVGLPEFLHIQLKIDRSR